MVILWSSGSGELRGDVCARALPVLVPRVPLARQASPGVSMTLPGVAGSFCTPAGASASRDGHHYGVDAREACCWLGAEARLGEQPRVFRLGAPAARNDGKQPDVQVLREVR